MSSRLYIGNLTSQVSKGDIEELFRKFGPLQNVIIKDRFGFVQLEDSTNIEEALRELNGIEFRGSRITVERPIRKLESARGNQKGLDTNFRPYKSPYCLAIENLAISCSWRDLKSIMQDVGVVTSVEAHIIERTKAIVCFRSYDDLKRAISKYQGAKLNGLQIKLIDRTDMADRDFSSQRTNSSDQSTKGSVSSRNLSLSSVRSMPERPRAIKSSSQSSINTMKILPNIADDFNDMRGIPLFEEQDGEEIESSIGKITSSVKNYFNWNKSKKERLVSTVNDQLEELDGRENTNKTLLAFDDSKQITSDSYGATIFSERATIEKIAEARNTLDKAKMICYAFTIFGFFCTIFLMYILFIFN